MKATELFFDSGKSAGVFCCGKCGQYRGPSKEYAESCCRCSICGEEVEPQQSSHSECWYKQQKTKTLERLDSAIIAEDYHGMIFDWQERGSQNGYFESVESMVEYYSEEIDCEIPEWAFCCTSRPPAVFDIDDILQHVEDNGFEEMSEHMQGQAELTDALNTFYETNKHVLCWDVDYSRKIRVWGDA